MTGDDIRQVTFREARRRGYSTDDVDALVEQLADAADRGEPIAQLATEAAFREARRSGYRTRDVDEFLERVASPTG